MGNNLKNYLSFSKKETIAAVILIGLVIPFALLPVLNSNRPSEPSGDEVKEEGSWMKVAEAPENNNENRPKQYPSGRPYNAISKTNYGAVSGGKLFKFDPNTASLEELKSLGLRDKTVNIINNYRNKGGRFRKADDLQKIYGLQPSEFERLKPFIAIAGFDNETKITGKNANPNQYPVQTKQEWKKKGVVIDINTADTTAFQSLYGIGSRLAARIVNFRNKLGGFYSVEQVGETYGVPEETFQNIRQYLSVNSADIKKININTAPYEELNAHPYISSKLAFLIMKHRKEKGNFPGTNDLKELVDQTNDSFEKVINYLTF